MTASNVMYASGGTESSGQDQASTSFDQST
jgi:hypothetical protein